MRQVEYIYRPAPCLLSILFMAIMILLFLHKYPVPSLSSSSYMTKPGDRYAPDDDDGTLHLWYRCHRQRCKKVHTTQTRAGHKLWFNPLLRRSSVQNATAHANHCWLDDDDGGCFPVQPKVWLYGSTRGCQPLADTLSHTTRIWYLVANMTPGLVSFWRAAWQPEKSDWVLRHFVNHNLELNWRNLWTGFRRFSTKFRASGRSLFRDLVNMHISVFNARSLKPISSKESLKPLFFFISSFISSFWLSKI